jgi:cytochrome c biogenesis protein CcmG/thiol:disulfide interchange protein DsbE
MGSPVTQVVPVTAGAPAPDFHAKTLDATPVVKTLANYRGEVVLLNLWATWCGPCQVEMPSIEALYRDYGPKGLHVVGVATDDPGFEDRVRTFVREHGLTFEVLSDGTGAIENSYQALGIPSTYLIGRDGIIRKRVAGASDWNSPANRALVAQLLGVPVVPLPGVAGVAGTR